MREASCGSMMPAISKYIVSDFVYIYIKCTAAHYRGHYHMMSHTAAHCCRTHHRTQPRALTHTATRTYAYQGKRTQCHTCDVLSEQKASPSTDIFCGVWHRHPQRDTYPDRRHQSRTPNKFARKSATNTAPSDHTESAFLMTK
jgi:hypothetical protein